MVLSNEARGVLETHIDNALLTVPQLLQYFRDQENQKSMHYKEPEDVVFGYVWGYVTAAFLPMLYPELQRGVLTQENLVEARNMIHKRSKEIRDRIFDVG
jgi:hypothetical protein